MTLKIVEMENRVCEYKDTSTDVTVDEDSEFDGSFNYKCEYCDFITEHQVGLKIHVSKTHKKKVKCVDCEETFSNESDYERHKEGHDIMNKLFEEESDTFGLKVQLYKSEEACLGLFSSTKPRDDGLPSLFLHSEECWVRAGHSCPDLPPPKDYDWTEHDAIPDYDFYEPTLMDKLVLGHTSLEGYRMDWARMEKIIKDW